MNKPITITLTDINGKELTIPLIDDSHTMSPFNQAILNAILLIQEDEPAKSAVRNTIIELQTIEKRL
jgi:hypothetical protein